MKNIEDINKIRAKEIERLKQEEKNLVSIENEERNLKSLARLTFILSMNVIPIVFSKLLLVGIDTFIYPLLAFETIGLSELTTIFTNLLDNFDNRKREKNVIKYLNTVANNGENGIKVGKECTIDKYNKLQELEEQAEKAYNNRFIANVIGKLMFIPEILGFVGTILTPGTPQYGLILSSLGLIANIICKCQRHYYSKELTNIETKKTKLKDNLDLSVYYVKYNKPKDKEKTKTEQPEYSKTLDLIFSPDQLEATEEYLKSLEETSNLSEKPFQKIKTSEN